MKHLFQNKTKIKIGIISVILVSSIGIAMTWIVLSLSFVFQLGQSNQAPDNQPLTQQSMPLRADSSAALSHSNGQAVPNSMNPPADNQNNSKGEAAPKAVHSDISGGRDNNGDAIGYSGEPGDTDLGGRGEITDNNGYYQGSGKKGNPSYPSDNSPYSWGNTSTNHSSDTNSPERISSDDVSSSSGNDDNIQDNPAASDSTDVSDNPTDDVIPTDTTDSDSVGISMKADTQVLPEPGQTFEVEVQLDKVNNLGGFQFDIQYDPEVLSISEGDGGVLGSAMENSGRNVTLLGPKVEAGKVTVGGFSFGDQPGFTGSGDVVKLHFKVKNKGDGALSINNVTLTDTAAKPIKVGNTENSGINLR